MEEVQAICDRVAIVDRGRVLVSGALQELLQDRTGLLTLRLRSPLPPALAEAWRARHALQDDGEARYRLQLRAADEVAAVLASARDAGCEPLAIAYGRRDLEQLFMQLTDRSLRD